MSVTINKVPETMWVVVISTSNGYATRVCTSKEKCSEYLYNWVKQWWYIEEATKEFSLELMDKSEVVDCYFVKVPHEDFAVFELDVDDVSVV